LAAAQVYLWYRIKTSPRYVIPGVKERMVIEQVECWRALAWLPGVQCKAW